MSSVNKDRVPLVPNSPPALAPNLAEKVNEQSERSQQFANVPDPKSPGQGETAYSETYKSEDKLAQQVRLEEKRFKSLQQQITTEIQEQPKSPRASFYKEMLNPMLAKIEAERKKLKEDTIEPDDTRGAELHKIKSMFLNEMEAIVADCRKNCDSNARAVEKQRLNLVSKVQIILIVFELKVAIWEASDAQKPLQRETKPQPETQP